MKLYRRSLHLAVERMTGTPPDSTEQPLRILMTTDAVGGVWRYSLDLINGLAVQGAQVLLATMGPRPSSDQRKQIASIPNVTLVESDYALEWTPNPWADVDAAAEWLLGLADTFLADVVHLNGYAHAALPWRRPVVIVAHSCVSSWWRAVHACTPGVEWEEYRRRVAAGLLAAHTVIAPSAVMAKATATEYNVPLEQIRVIHNFSHADAPSQVPKEAFFLAAGRIWDQAKNIAMLAQITPRLNWEMRVSGSNDGAENPAVASLRFLGVLPYAELLDQMSRASVFVHPALYEPFGLSVLEAARRNCCLVLADIPSLRELWEGAALFVDPRDPEAWVRELNLLTDDPQRRQALGYNATSRALKYEASTAVNQYLQLYRSLISSYRHPDREEAA